MLPHCTKWLPPLLLALALGALSATTVAWSIAWTNPQPLSSMGYGKRRATEVTPDPWPLKWYVHVESGRGMLAKQFLVDTGDESLNPGQVEDFEELASDSASRAAIRRHAFLLNGKDRMSVGFMVHIYGWPIPYVASESAFTADDARFIRSMRYEPQFDPDGFIDPSLDPELSPDPRNTLNETYSTLHIRGHHLPLRPLPGPFALCTIFYSFLWFGAFLTLRTVRRKLRLRAGHCPICRYNLAGLPPHTPCPECGSHVPPPPSAPIG